MSVTSKWISSLPVLASATLLLSSGVACVQPGGNAVAIVAGADGSLAPTLASDPVNEPAGSQPTSDPVNEPAGSQPTSAVSASGPEVLSIEPSSGPAAGGTPLRILGSGFLPGATVHLGGADCGGVEVVSSVEISCVTGPAPGRESPVSVTNADGGNGVLARAFTYVETLRIVSQKKKIQQGTQLDFDAIGGMPPYQFAVLSGPGSIDRDTGVFNADGGPGAVTVQVVDSLGEVSNAAITVRK